MAIQVPFNIPALTGRESRYLDDVLERRDLAGNGSYILEMTTVSSEPDRRSWWRKTFGRSLLKMLLGDFFEKKRNTASILAIMLVATVCYVIVWKEKYDFLNPLLNVIFVVIGFYFGTKPGSADEADEDA